MEVFFFRNGSIGDILSYLNFFRTKTVWILSMKPAVCNKRTSVLAELKVEPGIGRFVSGARCVQRA